jgi:hypothetical protein
MSLIPFPNVPDVLGVPQIPRLPNQVPEQPHKNLTLSNSVVLREFDTQYNWGVFAQDGTTLGDPANFSEPNPAGALVSFNSFVFSKEYRTADFPVEGGRFASYNKVEMPANPIVVLAYGGSPNDRYEFLNQIQMAADGLDGYDIVTPEITYLNYSIDRYDYPRQNDRGATLLVVRLFLKEIRTVTAKFTQINAPKSIDAKPTKSAGKVQAAPPKQSVINSVANSVSKVN